MIPDRLPILTWGPRKLKAWAGQLVDVLDARQAIPGDGSVLIEETTSGRALSVAIFAQGNGGGITPATKKYTGFDWYNAPYLGTGPTPPGQGLIIRFRTGILNENLPVENMGSEFTLTSSATNYVRLTTTQNAAGTPTSASLDVSIDLPPPDPIGTPGVAPVTSSRLLWIIVTNNQAVQESTAQRIGGIDVYPVIVAVDCDTVTLKMEWSRSSVTGSDL